MLAWSDPKGINIRDNKLNSFTGGDGLIGLDKQRLFHISNTRKKYTVPDFLVNENSAMAVVSMTALHSCLK